LWGSRCQPAKPPNYPTGAIELKYYAPGTWTVSAGGACCDSSGNEFDLHHPTNLGPAGKRIPENGDSDYEVEDDGENYPDKPHRHVPHHGLKTNKKDG
jgi:hypothetical protein